MSLWVKLTLVVNVLILIFFTGCQSWPKGEKWTEIENKEISILDLYKYYEMCRAAWREKDSWMESGWPLDYFYNAATDSLGLFIQEEDTLYIIFRSSRAFRNGSVDFLYNMKIRFRSLPFIDDKSIKVHSGFLGKYISLREFIHKRVSASDIKNVVLLGHSAGGAMASIAFLDLKLSYPEIPLYAVTYGMPRVYNSRGAKWFQSYREKFIRVVNGRDVIPNIPSSLFGYRHVGQLVRIGKRPFWKIFSVADHHPGYYNELVALLRLDGIEPSTLGY